MNKEKALKLMKEFPRLLRKSVAHPSPLQFRGIEAGDGWFNLLHQLLTEIEAKAITAGISKRKWPRVLQIKEKFGVLRFSIDISAFDAIDLELVRNIISAAETKSLEICEECGEPGTLYKSGWMHVKCLECEAALRKKEMDHA
jgi:hypothetical protein